MTTIYLSADSTELYPLTKSVNIDADDYTDSTDWMYQVGLYASSTIWFNSDRYASTYNLALKADTFYGMLAQRFIPVWEAGFSIGDETVLLTASSLDGVTPILRAESFDLLTVNTITIAGASQLFASTVAALAIASVL